MFKLFDANVGVSIEHHHDHDHPISSTTGIIQSLINCSVPCRFFVNNVKRTYDHGHR